MVRLFCAVVGDGRMFPVEIDLDETVGELKEMINPDLSPFNAALMNVYLARRGDTWLTDNDDDVRAVSRGDIPDTIRPLLREPMRAARKLSVDEYFGKIFTPGDGDVHVLVQLPTAKKPRLACASPYDGSKRWLSRIRATDVLSTALPSIQELAEFVASPLSVKIGLGETELLRLESVAGDTFCDTLFVHDEYAPCMDLWEKIFVRALVGAHVGHTQLSFITFWDSFIREPLMTMLEDHSFSDRHASDSTSTEFKRPNLVFTFKDVCVFRGQESAPGVRMSFNPTRNELKENVLWCFGDVPYVFGYTTVSYECALFAIFSTDQKTVDTELIATFDTGYISDRFKFVLALIQLSRLFPAIVRLCPHAAKAEFKDIRRDNGAVVRLNPTFAVRDFTNARDFDGTFINTRQLEVKYIQLKQLRVRHMEYWTKTSVCGNQFTFEPCGFEQPPMSLYELSVSLQCVLEALVDLHSHGWMHRDIRWPNVLKTRGETPQWFLIDLADAARSPQQFPDGSHLSRHAHAPEIFVEGGEHTSAVDVWSIGYLIQESLCERSWNANEERRAFLESLLEEDPTKRPTAAQALETLKTLKTFMREIPNDEGEQA